MDKKTTPPWSTRAGMAQAWARYHMARRRLRLMELRWKAEGAALVSVLQGYYDAQAGARSLSPWFDDMTACERAALIGVETHDKGVQAEERCQLANDELVAARNRCFSLMRDALHETGVHHGARMAADMTGSVRTRYWRHAREMAANIRSNLPGNRLVGLQEDFDSALGWAKSMGLKSARALVAMLAVEGVAQPCVLAH